MAEKKVVNKQLPASDIKSNGLNRWVDTIEVNGSQQPVQINSISGLFMMSRQVNKPKR